ncbi:MAG: YceH family protein [Gemmatimonadota bacterium]
MAVRDLVLFKPMLSNDLDSISIRALGSLIEKELSTPDHYPLSLNALTAACNQSSNRDPVMSLDERAVSEAIVELRRRGIVRSIQGIGSRVPKYQHLLVEAGEFTRAETAVLSVLMLRGPQTQAELRTRAARLMPGDDPAGLDTALDELAGRERPLVVRLARRPGQKESRFAHLLGGQIEAAADDAPSSLTPEGPDRIAALEGLVQELRNDVTDLRSQLAAFRKQFE